MRIEEVHKSCYFYKHTVATSGWASTVSYQCSDNITWDRGTHCEMVFFYKQVFVYYFEILFLLYDYTNFTFEL